MTCIWRKTRLGSTTRRSKSLTGKRKSASAITKQGSFRRPSRTMNPLNFLSFNGEQSYQAEQEQLYESITLGNATAPSSNRRTGHYPPIGFAYATPFPARRLKCDHCDGSFTNVEDLQVHTLKAHLPQTAGAPSSNHQIGNAPTALTQAGLSRSCRNKCNDCGACFTNVGDLQVHTLTAHHQEEEATPPPYAGGFHFEAQPINLVSAIEMTGKFRGIQGENNSCYLSTLLSWPCFTPTTPSTAY